MPDKLKKKFKLGSCFSIWRTITLGIPQDRILCPLLFNIFMKGTFLFVKGLTLCNYADNNAQFCCEEVFDQVTNNLLAGFCTLKQWSYHNNLVLNPKKYHFMTFGNKNNFCNFVYNDVIIKKSLFRKMSELTMDSNLDFSGTKLNALFR